MFLSLFFMLVNGVMISQATMWRWDKIKLTKVGGLDLISKQQRLRELETQTIGIVETLN